MKTVVIPIANIDVPKEIESNLSATAAEARAYLAGLEGGTGKKRTILPVPIMVRRAPSGRYVLLAGDCRLKIAQRAGVSTIVATIEGSDGYET